jgi:hypothetical protein
VQEREFPSSRIFFFFFFELCAQLPKHSLSLFLCVLSLLSLFSPKTEGLLLLLRFRERTARVLDALLCISRAHECARSFLGEFWKKKSSQKKERL